MNINFFECVCIIIGTMIGAGFASGKEIFMFFTRFDEYGIIGITITSIILYIVIYNTLYIVKENKITNNYEFINSIVEDKMSKEILNKIINYFLVCSFYIMSTGIGTFLKQNYKIPIIVTSFLNAVIFYNLIKRSIKAISKLNLIVVPLIIISIILILIYNRNNIISNFFIMNKLEKNKLIIIVNAIMYASYNSITLIPIIISVAQKIKKYSQIKKIAGFTSLIIFILAISIHKILLIDGKQISKVDMPILRILELNSNPIINIYSTMILMAMVTTAVSSLYGVLDNIENKNKSKKYLFVLCLLEIPISYLGFGNLISILYPIFGIMGFFELFMILKHKRSIAKNVKN